RLIGVKRPAMEFWQLRNSSHARKVKSSHGNANTDKTETEPDRRRQDPAAAAALRRRAAVRKNGAGEHAPRLGVGGVAGAGADGKRWPDRQPSGQGLGIDRDRPVRTRRGRPTARLAAVEERQL